MPTTFLYADDQGETLLCPLCGFSYTHIDDVFVAGRPREDGPIDVVKVASDGRVSNPTGSFPIPDVGRRHAFSLQGWCEGCGGTFALEFLQHKGETKIAVRQPQWTEVVRRDPTT